MVKLDFLRDDVLLIELSGRVDASDLESAWSSLSDPRFSARHDVIIDARDARIGFGVTEIPPLVRRHDRLPAGAQGITCFVTESYLSRAVIRMIKGMVLREARWHVVSDVHTAFARVRERRCA